MYENQVYLSYKQVGRVPNGFQPAGSNQSLPDFMFLSFKNVVANIELKVEGENSNTTLDYGQLGITQLDDGAWTFSSRSPNRFLTEAFSRTNLLDQINRSRWGKTRSLYLATVGQPKNVRDAAYDIDKKNFYACENWINGGIRLNSDTVRNYYALKGVNYINIKNRGLYLVGKDVLGLNPAPFEPSSVSAVMRFKSSPTKKTIRFTTALRVSGYPSSRGLDLTNRDQFLDIVRRVEFPELSGNQVLTEDSKNRAIGFQSRPK